MTAKHHQLWHRIARLAAKHDDRIIVLDYPIDAVPRYGFGKPLHPQLQAIIDRGRGGYAKRMEEILARRERLLQIPARSEQTTEPSWINGYLPGLDSAAIYTFVGVRKPRRFFEVGSGHSTRFVARAISDENLPTKITSIDPEPRAEIDALCSRVIRRPVEEVGVSIFDELDSGDILFVDGTHRSFMNSDVTAIFLDVLPRLKPGVLVGFHDILLPCDYPPDSSNNFYNEQYMLAAAILFGGTAFDIVFPSWFASHDKELCRTIDPLWNDPGMAGVERHGSSFWIEMR